MNQAELSYKLKRYPKVHAIAKRAARVYRGPGELRARRIYQQWLLKNEVQQDESAGQKLDYRPLFSVVVPAYNTPEKFFKGMLDSVINQSYDNWELLLVDDASPKAQTRHLIEASAKLDKRIRYKFLNSNVGISGATNAAINLAKGEFICLFDHDDVLRSNALSEIAVALNHKPYDIIYTDEDKIVDTRTSRHQPFLKPGWNKDALYTANYITHFTTIRKTLLDKVGYEDSAYDGAQDWELILRCSRAVNPENIHHIPKVLYSWRVHADSTAQTVRAKPYVIDAQKRAIESDLSATGYSNYKVELDHKYPGQWKVVFPLKGSPRVCILLKDTQATTQTIQAIKVGTSYDNYDIVTASGEGLWAKLTDADFIVVYDGKLRIKNRDWVQDLLRDAARPDIGFVQAKLSHKTAVINNLSVTLMSPALGLLKRLSSKNVSNHFYLTGRYNVVQVHGGLVMVQQSKLRRVLTKDDKGTGLTELSVRLHQQGKRNLYNPYVEVIR